MITKQVTNFLKFNKDGSIPSLNKKIGALVISAANEDYKAFDSKSIRQAEFENLPYFVVYKIEGIEYIITGNKKNNHEFKSICVYNYNYIEKWLIRH